MVCSAEILENRLRAPLWAHILYMWNFQNLISRGILQVVAQNLDG